MNRRDIVWGADRKRPTGDAQLSFAERRSWGGPRKGAGRKPASATRRMVSHAARAAHRAYHPAHITMRRAKGLPSLRSQRVHEELLEAIRKTRREGFRIVHYSVQADHIHLIVEAEDARSLAAGMKSFAVRAARGVNTHVLHRTGAVWGDRYHRRDLGSPREVRHALVYVMNNHLKHHEWDVGLVDPCSSAPWFRGWMQVFDPPAEPSPVEDAETWLLDRGWHDNFHFLHLGELPHALRS